MWNSIAKYVDVVCARVVVSNGVCPSVYGKQNAFLSVFGQKKTYFVGH